MLLASMARAAATQLAKYHSTFSTAAFSPASPTNQGLALDQYMRARFLLEDASLSSALSAIELLRRAVEQDPGFALAWSALADTHILLTAFQTGGTQDHVEQARVCAETAVRLDPGLSEGHASLATVRQHSMDWPGAERSYREALRLKPVFPRAHRWYAGFILQFGRTAEALEHASIALAQDPYDKMGPAAVGLYLLFAGRAEEAIAILEPAVEGKDLEGLRYNLAQAYARRAQLRQGQERQNSLGLALAQAHVIASIEKRKRQPRPLFSDRLFALIFSIGGDVQSAGPYLDRGLEDMHAGTLSPAEAAWPYAVLHNYPVALDLLERAYQNAPRSLLYLKVNPFLENLKGQPRFNQLVLNLRLDSNAALN